MCRNSSVESRIVRPFSEGSLAIPLFLHTRGLRMTLGRWPIKGPAGEAICANARAIELKFRMVHPHTLSGRSAIRASCPFGCGATNSGGGIGGGCDVRSFGGLCLCAAGGRLLLLLPEQPALQPVEVDIDNRRRIEREDLRHCQAADDGIA